ncbi:MAG TPA: ATP-binding protein [Vicinamibacterales bacterium]|nr:ATP-binding protein [Vicinamibacterales bacterium]
MNPLRRVRALPQAAALGAVAAAAGAFILLRWWLNIELLNGLFRGRVLMMPWTAAGFLLLGLSLWIQARASRRPDGTSPRERWAALGCAAFVLAIGLITQLEFLTGWNPGFDLLLFEDSVRQRSTMAPGRISPVASVVQPLLALSLIMTAWPLRSGLAAVPALLAIVAGLIGLSGNLYEAETLFSVAGYPAVSMLVAVLFLTVGVGALLLQPDQPVMAPFMNRHGGGAMGRRLLPAVVVLPMLLGWARLQLELAGWYGFRVGLALYTCSNIVAFAILIWWTARLLNSLDEKREAVEHRARTSLAESELRYRTLAESLPQLIWTCRPDGWCDYLSPQWMAYTGRPEIEQLGSGWSEQVHPDDLSAAGAQWAWSVKSGEPFDVEFRIRRHDGVYRWFRTLAVPVRDASGVIVKWFGSNADIDDRKRAEADLQELTSSLERRVEERTAELLAAKEHAESADRLKTDFIMTMSHELRTPLNSIIGFTGTLLTQMPGPLTAEQEKQLRIVQSSGRHLLMLINDVLDVAKIEAGSFSYNPQQIDAAQILKAVGAELAPLAHEKGLGLECTTNAPWVPLTTDVRAIRQVLINLITNAIKFTERGAVALSANVFEDGDSTRVELSVSDSGIGIHASDLPRLFMKFGRLDDARNAKGGGTGLGLYLCKLITERLDARLAVHSEPGRGSTFTVVFREPVQRGRA